MADQDASVAVTRTVQMKATVEDCLDLVDATLTRCFERGRYIEDRVTRDYLRDLTAAVHDLRRAMEPGRPSRAAAEREAQEEGLRRELDEVMGDHHRYGSEDV